MKYENMNEAIDLWRALFNQYCYCRSFPNYAIGGKATIERYLKEQIDQDHAIVVIDKNVLVGYMAWEYFDFHSEKTAFLPIVGHAALLDDEYNIYEKMYCEASERWVADNRLNHLWMTYFDDDILKNNLYNLGFGSYVIDACQSTDGIRRQVKSEYRIAYASPNDIDALLLFANETKKYYAGTPIFLKRSNFAREEIVELIDKDYALLAWDQGKLIGVMSFTTNQDFDFEHLTTPDSAYIGSIGAFIHPDYRGKGLGKVLLENVFECCNKNGKPYLHVCFESANSSAMRFWPKHFKPSIRSLRRTVNKDANTI
jgi:Sortase and related acyltransferases